MQGRSDPSVYPLSVTPEPDLRAARNRSLLLTRDFGLVWSGQLISQIGDGASKLALLWFVYAITGSPLKTSVIALLQTVPPIVLGPIIGVYVDRLPKKYLLIISDLLRAVLIGFIPCLIPVDSFTVPVLYALVLLHAVATAVFGPALTAAVPAIVTKTQFTAANALLQSTTGLGIVLGPALSGLGIAAYGSQEVLCLNATTYTASALCLILARFGRSGGKVSSEAPSSTLVQDLTEGFRYSTVCRPVIFLLSGTAALYTFGTAALTALFPVFARKILDLGPVEVGYLWSALGVGLLLTSIALLWVTEWTVKDRMQLVVSASMLSGTALCTLTWTPHAYQAGFLMGLIGGSMGVFTPIAWGIIQELTPGHLIGRVLALYGTGAMTSAIAGISSFGWITERYGPGTGLLGIGIVMFATAWVALRMSRACARY